MKFKTLALLATTIIISTLSSCKKEGCTDPEATNYSMDAKKDDGSCVYPSVTPTTDPVVTDTSATDPSEPTVTLPNTEGLKKLGSLSNADANAIVELWAGSDLVTGFNMLYLVTKDLNSGELLKDGSLSINPMMDMGMHMHSAPFVNPAGSAPNEKGLYLASVVFIMPGNTTQKWTLNVKYKNNSTGREGDYAFPIEVGAGTNRLIQNFTASDDSARIFISWKLTETPQVGINEFVVQAHYRKNMMEFPPLDNLLIEMEPEMPTMGHGSPDNVHPVFQSAGTYVGKVNFTMTGLWKINLKVKRSDGSLINDAIYFEYTL